MSLNTAQDTDLVDWPCVHRLRRLRLLRCLPQILYDIMISCSFIASDVPSSYIHIDFNWTDPCILVSNT